MVNEVCWGRLAGLCQLAAFFRPYPDEEAQARALMDDLG